jgi:soluble lytic murein transglycosylase
MPPRPLQKLLIGALFALGWGSARADDPAQAPLRAALAAAEQGRLEATQAATLARHPLAGWLEYATLRQTLAAQQAAPAQALLVRYRGQAVATAFRELWLTELARREDWPALRAAWAPTIDSVALRCAELAARSATGATDAAWVADAQALWRGSHGTPLPAACDAPLATLAAQDGLPPALRWERIERAAVDAQPAVMRASARGLPIDEAALAEDYAAFVEAPHARALAWPNTARSRLIASHGLAKRAKAAPDEVEGQLDRFADALDFGETERGRVLYQVALWTVASYGPESARRLAAVPASAYDERLHEWRVREALARADWPAALAALREMGAPQRADSRWTYFEARLRALTGDTAGAQAAYRAAARKPDFHGFLAADRIGQAYALCPWIPYHTAAVKTSVAREPALVRALALYRLDRRGWAQREWDDALSRFTPEQRRIAVDLAQQAGWFDRAVFALGSVGGQRWPDELRLYRLRFPLQHEATIRRAAKRQQLDPAWIAAEIRAESVFDPLARSPANALGLMQVLPATGRAVAAQLGLPWTGADSLLDADTNIALGSAYLREQLDQAGGLPYFAIAGYNAGPAPLARWRAQRPDLDPDFWIETISYKETREYVARVFAFSVIYDWRLNGDALPLNERMRGHSGGVRKQFACPRAEPSQPG